MLIKKLQLLTDNLKGTAKFYHQVLGLNLLQVSEEELSFAAGGTILSFHRSYQQKPQYHFAFNIPCNKIEEALVWMTGKAPVLDIEPNKPIVDFKNWNAKAFYFLDNNENILEFIARNDLKNTSQTPFDSSSILSVSEIGIVSEDVPQQCSFLVENFGVDYFDKQPPLPKFAALGDDSGLFIVVPLNRDWYPTSIASTRHWLKAAIEVNGHEQVLELYTRP
jgi:catechol-2,3-dioxygenase